MTSALTLHEHWARISRDAWATVTTAGDTDAAVMIRMPGFRTSFVWRIRLAANARHPVSGFGVAAGGSGLLGVTEAACCATLVPSPSGLHLPGPKIAYLPGFFP